MTRTRYWGGSSMSEVPDPDTPLPDELGTDHDEDDADAIPADDEDG